MRVVRRLWVALLFISLALGTVPAAARGGLLDLVPRTVDPYLGRLIRQNPLATLPVIIQLRGPVADVALLLAPLGGRATAQLPFINGVRAVLPAASVSILGQNALVHYISADTRLRPLAIESSGLQTVYNQVVGTPPVWNTAGLTGTGIGVAVLDTGFEPHPDLISHLTVIKTNAKALTGADGNGHGTHVAGVIAGRAPSGRYFGVAPDAQVIGIKVADDQGNMTEGDLLSGMQWVYDNRSEYNIRVVNISVTGTVEMSYLTSPLDAGVERLWRAGMLVVVAAGNRGDAANAVRFAPANDGFAVTVGALDDSGTLQTSDDLLAFFSSRGSTQDELTKPEVVAPGRKVVSTLASRQASLASHAPARIVDDTYLRLSGTSMATPVVAGAAALILQRHPGLTPDQLKWVLTNSATAYAGQPVGTAPTLDVQAALALAGTGTPASANQGLAWNTSIDPPPGSLAWNSTYWEASYWESTYAEPAAYEYLD